MVNPIFVQFFFIIFINIVHPIYAEEPTPILESTTTPEPTIEITPYTSPIITITQPPTPITTETPGINPFLETDKSDYSPTETVIISGHNFLSNTQYFLNITSDNLNIIEPITSNESGSFTYNYELDGIYRTTYKVEIKDLNNNIISNIIFTDRRDVISATINGVNSVNVFPKESIIVTVGVNTDWWWFWNNDWRSTSWRFGNSGNWNCVDTPDHLKSGDYFESFEIDSPSTLGKYQLQIRVYGLKNCNPLLKSDIFTLKNAITVLTPDTTPPIITIDPYNTTPTNQDITITASTNEGIINTTTHTFTENSSFTFTATDDAGNISNQTVNINNIDKTTPSTPSLISPLDGISLKGDSIINDWSSISDANKYFYESYSDQETSQLKCSQIIFAPDHSNTINTATDDTFWWRVRAIDNAENQSQWSELRKLIIDNTPPVITVNHYNTNPTNQNITVTASTNEGELNEKSHIFESNGSFVFIAIDDAGNSSSKTITITNIDKTSPILSFSINPNNPDTDNGWYKTQPQINLSFTDNNFTIIQYQWDTPTGEWINYIDFIKPNFEGIHTLYFRAIDLAGNQTTGFKEIKWDQTDPYLAPQNIIADPNPTSSNTSKIKWKTAKDNIGIDKYEIQWILNDINNPLFYSKTVGVNTTEVDIDKLIKGRWTVKIIAFDFSSRVKDNSIDLYITDSVSPTPIPTFKLNKTISIVTPKITPNQIAQDFSPEIKGVSSTNTNNSIPWRLILSLGIIILFIGGRRLFSKK
ncbi:MAG: hypothetical protein WC720_01470 [Candidatus Shapirobacteria bacterium]|jgi:hypothetical protein